MKTRSFALLCAVGIAAFFACQKEEAAPVQPTERERVKLIASVPATASIPQGSKLGLFASSPVNENNVTMTVGEGGIITLDKEIFWGEGQKEASSFLAYYPYSENYSEPTTQTFTASADQSTEAKFNASDLVLGKGSGKPSDSVVALSLAHKMSRLDLYFNNQSGKEISKVEVKGVKNQVSFDLNPATSTTEVAVKGEATNIQACKVTISSKTAYCAIIAPQTVNPTIFVTFSDGKTFETSLTEEKAFESGKTYSTSANPIIINDGTVKVNFSVSDWGDGGQLNFNGDEPGDYTPLADIAKSATSTSKSFSATVKDVVVTCVYNNYAFIQDNSGALTIFQSSHGLKAGQTINGEISGTIVLYDGNKTYTGPGFAEVTSIDVSKATIGSTSEIPYFEATVAQVLADPDKYYSARVLFKGITVTTGVSSSSTTGKFEQGGSSIQLFSKNASGVTIETGKTGNLYGYPTVFKGTYQVNVYYQDQWEEKTEPAEDNAFTKLQVDGVYNTTNLDAPVALFQSSDKTQSAIMSASSKTQLRLIQPFEGKMISAQFSTKTFSVGSTYSASLTVFGSFGVTAGSYSLKCVNKDSNRVWFRDTTNNIGYIFAIK